MIAEILKLPILLATMCNKFIFHSFIPSIETHHLSLGQTGMSDLLSIPVGYTLSPVGQAFGEAIPSEPACRKSVPSDHASCHEHFLNERRT
jgi:hypothetical protein